MTRKKYIHKMQNLIVAIAKHPTTNRNGLPALRIGPALRRVQDQAKFGAKENVSYEEMWNSEPIRWAREFYGVD